METKVAKVFNSGRRVVVDLKRKRSSLCETYLTGVSGKMSSHRIPENSSIDKFGKCRKLDGSKSKCSPCASQFKRSLLGYYSNFMRSGVPKRLMFYQDGEWSDFPQDLVGLIKKDLEMKKAAIEVEQNGQPFLLDLLHMMKLELRTGLGQPIAWIDEEGKCFFPEIFTDDDDDCGHHGFDKDKQHRFSEPYGYQDIRLQLEIEVNDGSDCSTFKEHSGESTTPVKKIQVDMKPADVEVEDACVRAFDPKVDAVVRGNQHKKETYTDDMHGEMDSDSVRKIFLMGMGSLGGGCIVDLYRGSMKARLELFTKQVEITKKCRGDANIRYGWLPSSKGAISSIMMYGLGHCGTPETKSTYGIGVHLSPTNCAINSAIYCDVDENGVRHMVFCRVIMGSMELVHAGSEQSHPSSESFDSGVDDLQNPQNYIVWNVNKDTHIYPEYAVSFKTSSDLQGCRIGNQSKLDISRDLNSSPNHLGINCPQIPAATLGSSTTKTPKSPWMPFRMLFAAVANKVPPEVMKLVETNYKLFMGKTISRDDFVQRLRMIVGDDLLKSILTNLQSKSHLDLSWKDEGLNISVGLSEL
ncbi:inactive poly [ADP-ribose] polymerase RCD1-like isoform X3 [Actinidia eriantha]|uniref:inactive poly [ADP-ribose] polymerase RCD1-like isoform X3 n=1 Tax=Actinidia eriantha TaxID=165200 RepID=UPI00258A84E4|nr:inactive poly [ADP-ribose] polymerase RCD1-like isoform X3 [Actinidia eriantha]